MERVKCYRLVLRSFSAPFSWTGWSLGLRFSTGFRVLTIVHADNIMEHIKCTHMVYLFEIVIECSFCVRKPYVWQTPYIWHSTVSLGDTDLIHPDWRVCSELSYLESSMNAFVSYLWLIVLIDSYAV